MRLFFARQNRNAKSGGCLVPSDMHERGNGSDPRIAKTSIPLPLSALQQHHISSDIKLTIGIMYTNLISTKEILRLI